MVVKPIFNECHSKRKLLMCLKPKALSYTDSVFRFKPMGRPRPTYGKL